MTCTVAALALVVLPIRLYAQPQSNEAAPQNQAPVATAPCGDACSAPTASANTDMTLAKSAAPSAPATSATTSGPTVQNAAPAVTASAAAPVPAQTGVAEADNRAPAVKIVPKQRPAVRIDNSRDWARALLDGIAVRSADAESSAQLAVIGAPTGVVARSAAGPSAADYRKLDTQMTGLLDTDPEDYRAYRHRAFARWQLGRTVSAVKDAKNAVRLAPKDVLSQSTLIGALVDAGRPKEAIEAARLAFEAQHGQPVDPALATLYHARSRAWAAVQEDDHELDDLARAAELQPDVYGSLYEHAKSVHAGAADLDRLLPEDSLTQTVLVVALAASVLIPLYLITSWWSSRRRAPRSLRISSPKKAIFAPRRW